MHIEFLTTKQTVALLNISQATLYRVREQDPTFPKPRQVRAGGSNRYIKSEILAFMGVR